MKTKLTLIWGLIYVLGFQMINAQDQRAKKLFDNGDYSNAIIEYLQVVDLDGYQKEYVENLATSYYNTYQFRSAYKYLKYLSLGKFKDKDKSYDNKFNYMTYQTLLAMGNYEKALEALKKYHHKIGIVDFNYDDAKYEIETTKLKEDDFKIRFSSFNSNTSEFGATIVDSTLYYVSDSNKGKFLNKKYKWTHRAFLDILKIEADSVGKFSGKPTSISSAINGALHEGSFCFTKDKKTIYFSKSANDYGKKKFDSLRNNPVQLYKSTFEKGNWTKPIKLGFNEINFSTEHPSLSADEKTLYFASNRPGGYGDFDIYKVNILAQDNYSTPENLGPVINTPQREQFPYVNMQGDLFFSSNGHIGLGMLDVFASEKVNNQYTKPINLGAPINSAFDDFSFAFYNKEKGFFSSNRKNANDDNCYEFKQIGIIFPRANTIKIEIRDQQTDSLIVNPAVQIVNRKNDTIFNNFKIAAMGTFEQSLFPGKYELIASAEAYKSNQKHFIVNENLGQVVTLYLDQIIKEKPEELVTVVEPEVIEEVTIEEVPVKEEKPKELTEEEKFMKQMMDDPEGPPVVEKEGKFYFELPMIYFDYNKWNIREDSQKVLQDFARKLDKYPSVYIKISSHTDNRGSDEFNQVLSDKRAESTRNYLALEAFVNARRMTYQGFGESQPLIDCETDECTEEYHQINRRSEFEITKF